MEANALSQKDGIFDAKYGVGVSQRLREIGDIDFKTRSRLQDFLGNEGFAIEYNPQGMDEERVGQFRLVCELLAKNTADQIVDLLGEPESMEEEFGTNENRAFLLGRLGLRVEIAPMGNLN